MIIHKHILTIKKFFITCIITYIIPVIALSCDLLNEEKIKYHLYKTQQLEHINSNQKIIIDSLQSALYFIEEQKLSNNKIKEYQKIMDNFSCIVSQLQKEHINFNDSNTIDINQKLSIHDLKQKLSRVNNQLINLSEQLKEEKNQIQSTHESLKLLPQQQIVIKNILSNLEKQRQIPFLTNINTLLECAKFTAFQSKRSAHRLKVIELELAQLSANNRQELSKLRIALLKKKYDHTNNQLQKLGNQLNLLYYTQAKQAIVCIEKTLSHQNHILPEFVKHQLQTNRNLSLTIIQQTHYINDIFLKKREIDTYIFQVHQTLADLIEQSQWVDKSPALGEALRTQISKLPKIPKFQQLNNNIAQLRAKRLQYENYINTPSKFLFNQNHDCESKLTLTQKNTLNTQLNIQRTLITLLLNNYDTHILELTKLKLSYEQLKDSLQEVQQATHRYLFWVADAHPITISYLLNIYHDTHKLFNSIILIHQIIPVLHVIFCADQNTLIFTILCAIILIGLHHSTRRYYYEFLERSSKQIGKVNQDNFLITFYNICSSMCIAIPIPALWFIIGYNLNHSWSTSKYPIITAIGDGINATVFILWIFILGFYFASPKGLFIMHFGWSKKKVRQVFSKHYSYAVIIIVFLILILNIFDSYNNREFSNTIGRLCFILLCIYLAFITNNLKQAGFPLYLNKCDSPNNIINYFLWNIMICAPIIAIISCIFGYLFVAQILLARLETSLFIWTLLLIVYYIIRRWMCIQRRRIAFIRAKKKRAALLIFRASNKFMCYTQSTQKKQFIFDENNKKKLDLDTISNKSLQLIRSIIILIALLLMTLSWSKLHLAFSFLENITLWDVTSTIKGVENIQPITLKIFLTIIAVILITAIMVRNLPAFLELILLQRLHLTPGTNYAITTLTKYILMLLGSLIGLSLIGIEWVKIQWLIAALGVGLGFGLQEIFANFISGLMILFEKPIRIGDTITIRNVTGNVTHINTRATIITDWDHKEIIIPNKEFITQQFINWSLSDTITRVILRIPAPFQIDIKEMINVLIKIIKNSPLALNKPSPEVYLISLDQGLPVFEIRTYTANIKSRIPLCHQINTGIIEYYKNNGLQLPCLPFYRYTTSSNIDSVSFHSSILELNKNL